MSFRNESYFFYVVAGDKADYKRRRLGEEFKRISFLHGVDYRMSE